MSKKLIVIGGVAAGMSAASKARRTDPNLEVTVYTDGEYISYAGCGLPYFIGGRIASKEDLIARSITDFKKQNIDVHTLSKVESIDPQNKKVFIRDLKENKLFEDNYDKLIIGTGARPFVPGLDGMHLNGIFTLRTINDSLNIIEFLKKERPKNISIIGGGYIGLEMAENFVENGCKVTVIERAPHIIPNMDADMAEILTKYLLEKGVDIRTGETVKGFSGNSSVKSVITDQGEIPTDFVLLSIGVVPNTEIVEGTGIKLGLRNAILVDRKMNTNIDGIFAAGDCATAYHIVTGKDVYMPLGTTANKQGRVAGENAAGGDAQFKGVIGTGIARVMEMEVSRTGLSERECQDLGIHYETRKIQSMTAAHYCPNSNSIHLKLIAERDTGCLLGAQIVGYAGAALRIDMLATAITIRSTVSQLIDMDLAYSPPFSPVWDPVLIALNQF
ncbi:MAG: CoA-disulfide reductase [Clostridiales bacterium]|jgi:NADPH-dependent 2,4-dienoyl-CoA reductase/sulfur reductase-like enzyme|nr:CoA-disulfide reductase [Clostridiales bacterium]